jgi:hypothetical protein
METMTGKLRLVRIVGSLAPKFRRDSIAQSLIATPQEI